MYSRKSSESLTEKDTGVDGGRGGEITVGGFVDSG